MGTITLTTEDLIQSLMDLPPVSFKAVELLQQLRAETGQLFPQVPADQLATVQQAAQQLHEYAEIAEQFLETVQAFSPVPVKISIPEYGL